MSTLAHYRVSSLGMVYLIYGAAGLLCNFVASNAIYGGYTVQILHVVAYLLHASTSPIAASHVCTHSSLKNRLLTTPFLLTLDLVYGMGVAFVLQLLDD
jgi:hypothetical protein